MHFIRALHVNKYDKNSRRFPSDCFKKYGDGISVFLEDCARAKSNDSICEHLQTYYPSFGVPPIIFCRINIEHLKKEDGFVGLVVEETLSESGDDCHRDLKGVSNNQAGKYSKSYFRPPNIFMCCNGQEKELSVAEYEDLLNNLC